MRAVVCMLFAIAGCSESAGAPVSKPDTISVDPADRACTMDADCTAILTRCSMCEGACTGVRVDRASRYDKKLDCTGYSGKLCNYDCRPQFKIEEPRCVDRRCESVRKAKP